ncbi:AAA family ATPase [Cellulophaga sp. BC115SP]|uniref:AAA family ATPase n=1 Tax=Cellulophaga sp. BC115SP TaxID=2683263 RepID=UPI001411F7A4|nr:AAA family ATPase [Cellulophaga sp. BC115SP]NBB28698.1 AAA family ATPase [Cellulophaga sp. BC115SP]
MKLSKIEIKGLFDIFDYSIPLHNEESLSIITGPNGFGKTMILNIIDSLFNNNLAFFQTLVFESILIETEDKTKLSLVKDQDYVLLQLEKLDIVLANYKLEQNINKLFSAEEQDNQLSFFYQKLNEVLNSPKVHLIKEQRLINRSSLFVSGNLLELDEEELTIDTIHRCAIELKGLLDRYTQQSYIINQQIDSTFPKRLLTENEKISIEEFNNRFRILRMKHEKLQSFGLMESIQEIPIYDERNANVLLVYLKDSEDKIKVFEGLLARLELFTSILNSSRFIYKTIKIDRKKGFVFITNKGKELKLTELSSGEQHEVVMLYELIFKTTLNTLVLIDEPELSLHVTWQKGFLNDILQIMKLQKMQVIIATHSPQIINDRWDLVFNLET